MRVLAVRLVASAIGLAFLLATPAEAAKARKHRTQVATKQVAKPPASRTLESQTVYFQGHVLGADPDPRIRHEIARDLGKYFGGVD